MPEPLTVLISGARGTGKSRLARCFADELDRLGHRYVMFDGDFSSAQREMIIRQAAPDIVLATTEQPVDVPNG